MHRFRILCGLLLGAGLIVPLVSTAAAAEDRRYYDRDGRD